ERRPSPAAPARRRGRARRVRDRRSRRHRLPVEGSGLVGSTPVGWAVMAARRQGAGGLLRSSAVVSVGVGLSRVTGLVRTSVLAPVIGTSALADGYNLANSTPNVIYDLMLGGVLAATLIPVIVERMEADDQRSIDAIATYVVAALIVVTGLGVLL